MPGKFQSTGIRLCHPHKAGTPVGRRQRTLVLGIALFSGLWSRDSLLPAACLPAQESKPGPTGGAVFHAPSAVCGPETQGSGLPVTTANFKRTPDANAFWANRGRWTFGLQASYTLEQAVPRNISHINLFYAQPQLGLIVHDFRGPSSPIRRFEVLSEGILGNAIHPGGRLTGYALLFRLNGKPWGHVIPFFDAGAGVLNTTLYNRAPELNGSTQFNPQGGFGILYFFKPQRAFVFEYRYMHMSNANLQSPNLGFNGSMLSVGFRWLRRPRPSGPNVATHPRNPIRYLFGAD